MSETLFTNARLVLPGEVVSGALLMRGAEIAAMGEAGASGVDLDGDYLLPGVVDLHTDNLERQVQPRTSARWPSRSAMIAHDAQVAAAGITTVLDSLCLGDLGFEPERTKTFREGVADLDAFALTGLLRAEHFLHLRCEMPAPDVLDLLHPVADHRAVRMISLMDHSPGVGQYNNEAKYRAMRARDGMSADEIERRIAHLLEQRERYLQPNRRALLERAAQTGAPVASHDDRTREEIARNHADGIRISEFPVSAEAAGAAHALGMEVIAGGPNIVRGGSHSGNVAAAALVAAGYVTALASDYVPASLIDAAFRIAHGEAGLPDAIALITSRPARLVGLLDRGTLAPGYRADLVRVRLHEGLPVVRAVWRAGERVA